MTDIDALPPRLVRLEQIGEQASSEMLEIYNLIRHILASGISLHDANRLLLYGAAIQAVGQRAALLLRPPIPASH